MSNKKIFKAIFIELTIKMTTTVEPKDSGFDFLNLEGLEKLAFGDVKSFDIPEERSFPRSGDVFLRDSEGNLLGKARILEYYGLNNETIGKYRVTEVF